MDSLNSTTEKAVSEVVSSALRSSNSVTTAVSSQHISPNSNNTLKSADDSLHSMNSDSNDSGAVTERDKKTVRMDNQNQRAPTVDQSKLNPPTSEELALHLSSSSAMSSDVGKKFGLDLDSSVESYYLSNFNKQQDLNMSHATTAWGLESSMNSSMNNSSCVFPSPQTKLPILSDSTTSFAQLKLQNLDAISESESCDFNNHAKERIEASKSKKERTSSISSEPLTTAAVTANDPSINSNQSPNEQDAVITETTTTTPVTVLERKIHSDNSSLNNWLAEAANTTAERRFSSTTEEKSVESKIFKTTPMDGVYKKIDNDSEPKLLPSECNDKFVTPEKVIEAKSVEQSDKTKNITNETHQIVDDELINLLDSINIHGIHLQSELKAAQNISSHVVKTEESVQGEEQVELPMLSSLSKETADPLLFNLVRKVAVLANKNEELSKFLKDSQKHYQQSISETKLLHDSLRSLISSNDDHFNSRSGRNTDLTDSNIRLKFTGVEMQLQEICNRLNNLEKKMDIMETRHLDSSNHFQNVYNGSSVGNYYLPQRKNIRYSALDFSVNTEPILDNNDKSASSFHMSFLGNRQRHNSVNATDIAQILATSDINYLKRNLSHSIIENKILMSQFNRFGDESSAKLLQFEKLFNEAQTHIDGLKKENKYLSETMEENASMVSKLRRKLNSVEESMELIQKHNDRLTRQLSPTNEPVNYSFVPTRSPASLTKENWDLRHKMAISEEENIRVKKELDFLRQQQSILTIRSQHYQNRNATLEKALKDKPKFTAVATAENSVRHQVRNNTDFNYQPNTGVYGFRPAITNGMMNGRHIQSDAKFPYNIVDYGDVDDDREIPGYVSSNDNIVADCHRTLNSISQNSSLNTKPSSGLVEKVPRFPLMPQPTINGAQISLNDRNIIINEGKTSIHDNAVLNTSEPLNNGLDSISYHNQNCNVASMNNKTILSMAPHIEPGDKALFEGDNCRNFNSQLHPNHNNGRQSSLSYADEIIHKYLSQLQPKSINDKSYSPVINRDLCNVDKKLLEKTRSNFDLSSNIVSSKSERTTRSIDTVVLRYLNVSNSFMQ